MIDETELASALFGRARLEEQVVDGKRASETTTIHGTAVSDSEAGTVRVIISDDLTDVSATADDDDAPLLDETGTDDTAVELPTTQTVREGEEVIITLVGAGLKTPTVTGVVGSGDRTYDVAASAADAAASLAKEVTSAWTAIESNSEQIALKANSTDVYTKTQTDGLISQEVTDRNAAITASADSITSAVAATYASKAESYQNSQPNLTPWFSAGCTVPDAAGYWHTLLLPNYTDGTEFTNSEGRKVITAMGDGWAHVIIDSRSSAGNQNKNAYINTWVKLGKLADIVPGGTYTWLAEVRNMTWVGASDVSRLTVCPSLGRDTMDKLSTSNVAAMKTNTDAVMRTKVVAKNDFSGVTQDTRGYMFIPTGCYAEFDVRVSLYEGEYAGPYKPFSDASLSSKVATNETRITQTEADVTTAINGVNGLNALVRQYGQGVLVCRQGNTIGALVNADGSFDIVSVTWDGTTPTAGATVGQVSASGATFLSGNANIVAHADGGLRFYGTSQDNALILADAWEDSAGNTYSGVTFNQILAWSYMESIETATVLEVIRAAKRKRTVLYNNASGSNGTITLYESAAKFDHMRIYFRTDDGVPYVNSCDVYSPNGKHALLSAARTIVAQTQTWLKTRLVSISGTSITTESTCYANTNVTYHSEFQKTNCIYITRVEGWLEVHPGLI